MPSLPLPENRPEVLIEEPEGSADVEGDADESVQSALQAFCDDGIAAMAEAEAEALAEAISKGKSSSEQEACKFSCSALEVNEIFPLADPACVAVFTPASSLPPAPAQPEEVYEGPEVDVNDFLNDVLVD